MAEYLKEGNTWRFMHEGTQLFQTEKIGILFSQSPEPQSKVTIHKHGDMNTMKEQLVRFQKAYQGQPEADRLAIQDVSHCQPKEINTLIHKATIPKDQFFEAILDRIEPKTNQTPPSKEMKPEVEHLLQGGRMLLQDPQHPSVHTCNSITKQETGIAIDPEDFRQELLIWPDGFEIAKEDYKDEDYQWRSDDFQTVTDMDEEMRLEISQVLESWIKNQKHPITLLENPIQEMETAREGECLPLAGLPIQEEIQIISDTDVELLRNQEANAENEREYQNARRQHARGQVARNLPPHPKNSHPAAYQKAAQEKILNTKGSPSQINKRLKDLQEIFPKEKREKKTPKNPHPSPGDPKLSL